MPTFGICEEKTEIHIAIGTLLKVRQKPDPRHSRRIKHGEYIIPPESLITVEKSAVS